MTFTKDFTSYIGQMRLVLSDTNSEDYDFSDEELTGYYNLAYEDVLQACLLAYMARINNYAKDCGDEYKVDTIEYKEGKSKASMYQSLYDKLKASIDDGSHPMLNITSHTYGIYTDEYEENIQRMRDGEIIPPRTFDRDCNQLRIKEQDGPYYNV